MSKKMTTYFKPIHFYNHESGESFQIVTREGLINWINDYDLFHTAFDTYEKLKERCLDEDKANE